MSKKVKLCTYVCKYVSAVFMMALIGLQFLPFWDMGEIGNISIAKYMWFPYKVKGAESFIAKEIGQEGYYFINDTVMIGLIVLVLCIVGIVYCLFTDKFIGTILPLAAGVVGLVWYLGRPEMQLGTNLIIHLIPCVLLIVVSVVSIVVQIKDLMPSKEVE